MELDRNFPWVVQAWDGQRCRNENAWTDEERAWHVARVWSENYPQDSVRLWNYLEDRCWVLQGGRVARAGTFATTTLVRIER